jgi:phosphoglucosamine mutase
VLRFGTDGVRGDAASQLTPQLLHALGRAGARVLGRGEFLIGRDTRESGPRIEATLGSGLSVEGARPVFLGVLPTPAIAYLAQRRGAPAAVVSASHNPWTDNGVKFLGADGRKLSDGEQEAIEAELERFVAQNDEVSEGVSSPAVASDAGDDYVAHLLGALDGRDLGDLHVVLDCANGAAFEVGPRVFAAAGARVEVLCAQPDGRNINARCGSTHPARLQAAVRELGAQLGLALDGDADRVLAVDERGELVDGDQIMAMTALDLHERGALRNDAIVVTVMSNLGLKRALVDVGIEVVETPVGDRHVTAAMEARDIAIGGEQSGHVVFADHATTGDGLLTGLLVADLVRRRDEPLSALAGCMTRLPQVLVNVRVSGPVALDGATAVWEEVHAVERELGDRGRVLLRASGTEPVVRVMVEAPSEIEAAAVADRVRAAVEHHLA